MREHAPGFIVTKQARRRTQNPLTGGRTRVRRGLFAAIVITDVDSYWSQLDILLAQLDEFGTRVRTEYERLRGGKRSVDKKSKAALWQEASLRVLGPDYWTLGNQVYSASELYCVAIYRVLERRLREFSKIRDVGDVATLAKLTKRYPQLKRAAPYKRVLELSLIYRAWLDGGTSLEVRRLKRIRPRCLDISPRHFNRFAAAVNSFAKAVQRAFRNRAP